MLPTAPPSGPALAAASSPHFSSRRAQEKTRAHAGATGTTAASSGSAGSGGSATSGGGEGAREARLRAVRPERDVQRVGACQCEPGSRATGKRCDDIDDVHCADRYLPPHRRLLQHRRQLRVRVPLGHRGRPPHGCEARYVEITRRLVSLVRAPQRQDRLLPSARAAAGASGTAFRSTRRPVQAAPPANWTASPREPPTPAASRTPRTYGAGV